MKHIKFLSAFLCAVILISMSAVCAFGDTTADFDVGSDSAVLMDLSTGQLIYSKNPDKRQYPAGITKAADALALLKKASETDGGIDAYVSVSSKTVSAVEGTSVLGLVEGEVLTLREALYGMLMQSANDCAVAAAENMFGSTDDFILEMNAKAKELGCSDTNFSNVTGLYDENHYTTASDIAKIVKAAADDPNYTEIAGTVSYQLPQTNKMGSRTLATRCSLLSSYEYAKTGVGGFTDEGKYAMAVTASNDNLKLLAVVMNSPDEQTRNDDCVKLLNYGFENYRTITLSPEELKIPDAKLMGAFGKIGIVSFKLDHSVSLLAPIEAIEDELEFQPQKTSYKKKDDTAGVFTVLYNGKKITELNLTGTPIKKITLYSVIKTILLILLALIVLIIGLFAFYLYDAEKKKRKRRREKARRRLSSK